MEAEGIAVRRGDAATSRRRSSSRPTRPCRPGTTGSRRSWSRSTSARCATRWTSATRSSWALGRVNPADHGETFCMTVLALKLCRARQRGVVAARPGLARDVDAALSRARAKSRCRSATSPTACTSRPGSRRRCGSSTTGTSAPTGRRAAATRTLGSDRRRRRRRALGDAPGAQGAADRLRRAAARPMQARAHGANPPEVVAQARTRAEPRRARRSASPAGSPPTSAPT